MILPNQLTVLRIILTPVFFVLFISDNVLLRQISMLVFVAAAITDWYDGWLARKFNYITEWGKFLDPLADKILTSTAFFAFVIIDVLPLWMVIVIVVRDIIVTLLRIYADYKKINFFTSKTAKWKTFFQMFFIYYLLLIYTLMTVDFIYKGNEYIFTDLLNNPDLIYGAMLFVTVLTFYTGIEYFFTNRKMIKQLYQNEN